MEEAASIWAVGDNTMNLDFAALKLILLSLVVTLMGCAVSVQDSGLTSEAGSRWLYVGKSRPKTIYSVNDEQVTYWAQLDLQLPRFFKNFRVDWVDPKGNVFLSKTIKNSWGTEDIIIATLPIRDNYPSRFPGDWKVRIYHGDELLDQARFTIATVDQDKPGGVR
jgi:hypothetical protein